MKIDKHNHLADVNCIELPCDYAVNGDLIVIEGNTVIPFDIARVFFVRAPEGALRGLHAHKECSQFLICATGHIEVRYDDGNATGVTLLNRPEIGMLVPPGIWAQQTFLAPTSVLMVLCDKRYDANDYIRDYAEFKIYRSSTFF